MKIFGENLGCSFHGGGVLVTNVIVVESNQISSHEKRSHVTEFGLYFVELNGEKSMSICNLGSGTLKPWQEGLMNK